ncbi:MAG: hypothetical protein O3C40_14270 [Planctomycetota bacterium]|nr:hypothetical protein [Planctomycetota bacterium]
MPSIHNRLLITTCVGLSLLTCAAFAQPRPDGRGRGGSGGGPPGFGGGGPLELLQRSDVQAELELLDDQKDEARELVEQFNERRRELFSGFAEQFRNRDAAEADREALQNKVQEAMRTLNKETEEGLSFLLPHQRKRLSQLEIQFQMRGGGGLGALGSREVGEQLAVTDEQREVLRDKALELGQEFGRKIAELRREMQEKLLAELNPEQRAKFQELVGDPFEFQDRPPGGGRDRGQRGDGERPQRPPQ